MHIPFFTKTVRSAAVALCLSAIAGPALAVFPERPIRMVVPFAPGGGTDLIARTIGAGMAKDLGQPVVVENRPGAGTMIGTDNVAKSHPDGYSIVVASFAHAINPALQPRLSYGSNDVFAPVILIGRGPNVLVVRPDSPIHSVADLVAQAKANPGSLTYASQGAGTSAHLAGALFAHLAQVDISHIPYRGAGPALTDLMGGHVDMMFATAAAVAPLMDSDKLRVLGVTTDIPSPSFEGVPTIAQTVPDYVVDSWYGLYVPANTPKEIIERLNAAARKAANSPDFVKKVEQEGLIINAGPPEELDTYVRDEEQRWAKIIEQSGIKPD